MLRNRPAAARLRDLRDTAEVPWICAINVEEVWRGLRPSEEAPADRFLGALRCVPLGSREGELAGAWRRDFASRGITLSQSDCLVAAAAVSIGARLATGNPKDFPMEDLVIEHWPPGA